MKYKISLFLFSLVLMFLLGSFEQASACSCGRASLCVAYNFADFIFVGKMIEENKDFQVFEVIEGFIGVKKGDKLKSSIGAGGSCAAGFEKNRSYLIFGHQTSAKLWENDFWKNSFWTTVCDRNSELEYANEDLKLLRNLPKENIGGKIFGKVFRTKWSDNRDLLEIPFANVSLRIKEIKNDLLEKTLNTDSNGKFELQVPVGTYQVKADLPAGFQIYGGPLEKPFEMRNTGCADVSYHLKEIKE